MRKEISNEYKAFSERSSTPEINSNFTVSTPQNTISIQPSKASVVQFDFKQDANFQNHLPSGGYYRSREIKCLRDAVKLRTLPRNTHRSSSGVLFEFRKLVTMIGIRDKAAQILDQLILRHHRLSL